MKAKTVVAIVLGLRFMHSHELLHDHLKLRNNGFDVDRHIQIPDFGPIRLEWRESKMGGFSG
jgi:hypothetical protein